MQSSLPPGVCVIVESLADNPWDGVDALRIERQAPPDPAALAPDDVIVEVRSAAVGWVDLLMLSGQYQHAPPLPFTPGLEYSGVVAWIGSAVDPSRLAVGDRVLSDGFLTGPRSKGPYQRYGGFASYAVAPASALRAVPTRLSFDQACSFLGSYETAYHCLVARGRLQRGEAVLIHGASGSTGLAAVHLGKVLGATIIATGRSPQKLHAVREQGADHVIVTAPADGAGGGRPLRDEVKALTGGRGVDVVYDAVGGEISAESLRCMAFGGRFLVVGWAATPFVADGGGRRGAPRANTLPTNLIMMKGLDVLGCPTVIATHHDPGIRLERLRKLFEWVESGVLVPHVAASYPLSRIKDALRAKWQSAFVGGCVVNPPVRSSS